MTSSSTDITKNFNIDQNNKKLSDIITAMEERINAIPKNPGYKKIEFNPDSEKELRRVTSSVLLGGFGQR